MKNKVTAFLTALLITFLATQGIMATDTKMSRKTYDLCYEKPGLFCKTHLGSPKKYDYQQEGFEAMLREKYVAIKSANGMGKTFTISDAILEALYVQGFHNKGGCYIVCTAPNWNTVKNVLFAEIRKKHKGAITNLGGHVNLTEITLDEKWKLIGFSPKKSADGDPSNFQGFHEALVIIVFEEATGVPRSIWNMAQGMTSSANVKMWAIGNPTDPLSAFADCFSSYKWVTFTWDCFKSVNLKANGIKTVKDIEKDVAQIRSLRTDEEKRDYINKFKVVDVRVTTYQYVLEMALDWGVNSPLFQAKVLAKFPTAGINMDIGIERMRVCMDPASLDEGYISYVDNGIYSIGVDVARYGDDKTAIDLIRGNKLLKTEVWSKVESTFIAGRVKMMIDEIHNTEWDKEHEDRVKTILVGVDVTGVGAGTFDILNGDYDISLNDNIILYEINFGAAAINDGKYVNLVSEARKLLADQINSPSGFILPNNHILAGELCNRRYRFDNKSRYWIESKDDFKKRTETSSPDEADALKIAWYNYELYKVRGNESRFEHKSEDNVTAYQNRET